jgi:dipeptidase E
MRLFLSSYRLGARPEMFAALVGESRRVALILSAGDAWGDVVHETRVGEQTAMLSEIGLEAADVDLRKYVGRSDELNRELAVFGSVWVAGGNTFVLRRAMRDSGFDRIIERMLRQDSIAYGGYSAGICVLAPSLRGLELVDDPAEVALTGAGEVLWDGLGVLPYTPVPHFQSELPESEQIDDVVRFLDRAGRPYRTLRDGEVIYIDGDSETLLGAS